MASFCGLGYRLVDLQVFRHQELSRTAAENTEREYLIEPRRGDILDARGNMLATSVFVKTICADPVLIGTRQAEVAKVLAPLLEQPEAEVLSRLQPRLYTTSKGLQATNRYVVLKRKVPTDTWNKIQEGMKALNFGIDESTLGQSEQTFYKNLRNKSIFADRMDDQLRVYPNGQLAAHVLGFVGMNERSLNGKPVLETVGKEGIELKLNDELSGSRGWLVTSTDIYRRELVEQREQDVRPTDGLNVVLTIDARIQYIVESALAEAMQRHTPISICALVVRPRTGEILAMATLPTFDPNNPGSATPDNRRNRVITDVAEPGSTFKVVIISAGLDKGAVKLTDAFDCENGAFAFGGRVLHDHEPYGVLTVHDIIKKSSNIGAAKVAIKLGPEKVYEAIKGFGFGVPSGLPLPGEVRGIVHPVDKWSKVTIAQVAMGHGLAVNRLQMTMAVSAIANKGVLMRPMLVKRLEDRNHNPVSTYSPIVLRRIIAEETAAQMTKAMKSVVEPGGTATKAALDHYVVAGKTGTAQKVENGVYVRGKYFSSFIGFFPADDPELCVSVMIDEPRQGYYGGQTAAPVFKQIAERTANYLNIRPDRFPEKEMPPAPNAARGLAKAETQPKP